ncbi:hypothetical protein Hanom_Chr12g01099231 [Helianthus anomalus]
MYLYSPFGLNTRSHEKRYYFTNLDTAMSKAFSKLLFWYILVLILKNQRFGTNPVISVWVL